MEPFNADAVGTGCRHMDCTFPLKTSYVSKRMRNKAKWPPNGPPRRRIVSPGHEARKRVRRRRYASKPASQQASKPSPNARSHPPTHRPTGSMLTRAKCAMHLVAPPILCKLHCAALPAELRHRHRDPRPRGRPRQCRSTVRLPHAHGRLLERCDTGSCSVRGEI